MDKKLKIEVIVTSAVILLASDMALIITGTKGQTLNAWWALALALLSILYGVFGLITAKYWSWARSKIGQAITFISLGIIMWGVGQAGWSYYYFKYPNQEYQPQRILDVLFFSSIPLWFYGVLKLTKASGARYGLQKAKGKLLVAGLFMVMAVVSYYFLVVVARGGASYFSQPLWEQFFDLGYSIGDAVIFTVALSIFGLSWRYLGGRFKTPIVTILFGFGVLYLADFIFGYVSGKDIYFNGDISDLLYLLAIVIITIAVSMLDPSKVGSKYTSNLPAPAALASESPPNDNNEEAKQQPDGQDNQDQQTNNNQETS